MPTKEDRATYLRERYPNPNDPRRDQDFGTRRPEFEIKQLLGAVLDQLYAKPSGVSSERVAQLIAHRACSGFEHNPDNGKFHGYCVVCIVPWPCDVAKERKD